MSDRRFVPSVAVAVGLTGFSLAHYNPPLPSPLTLQIVLPTNRQGESEPIVVTGVSGSGDFLLVRYVGEGTALFAYDSWGVGGPSSLPVEVAPGTRHALGIEMPSLAAAEKGLAADRGRLRLRFDGTTILEAEVPFHRSEPEQVYFAEDPIGGSCSPSFHGELRATNGREVRGVGRATVSPVDERLLGWLLHVSWQLLLAALIGVAAGFAAAPARRWYRTRARFTPASSSGWATAARHRWFIATLGLCALCYAAVSTGGTFHIFHPENFGNFYDFQAASLLQGRLDVSLAALPGEYFFVNGKYYGYFGLTPALLRIPFSLFRGSFGQLSRSFMLAYYVASLLAAYLILRWMRARVRGDHAPPSAWAVVVFTTGSGLGTTLLFLSSRAFVYHEAILCGVAFTLWGVYFTLRYSAEPERGWWIGALVLGTLAVHARPPLGLFALSLTGCTACAQLLAARRHREAASTRGRSAFSASRTALAIGGLSVACVLSFYGMSYLKFGSFEACPLRYHAQYDAERLARTDGKQFHWSNLPHNLDAYLLNPAFTFRRNFPYFFINDQKHHEHPHAKLDLVEPTLAMPYAMPAMFLLAFGGGAYAFRRVRSLRLPLLLLGMGVVPMATAMLAAVAISHRYTSDFCPFLICVAACGVAAIDAGTFRWKLAAKAPLSALVVVSVGITLAITLHYQSAVVWGTSYEITSRYAHLCQRIDGLFHVPTFLETP